MSEEAPSNEDRMFAILSHLSGLVSYFIAPLILLLVQRDRRSFGAWHSREALNFNVSLVLYMLVLAPLACLAFISLWFLAVPVLYFLAITVLQLVVVVVAALKAHRGVRYRCPLTIRFVPHPNAAPEATPQPS
jgi:uncharacterized Tic20 family protein